MLDFYNAYKEKILPFILYRFQRSIGIRVCLNSMQIVRACLKGIQALIQKFAIRAFYAVSSVFKRLDFSRRLYHCTTFLISLRYTRCLS